MDERMKMIKVIAQALDEKKGIDIKCLDISQISVMTDYFVIVNGSNENHVAALVENVEDKMHKFGYDLHQQEGNKKSNWVLMDFGDVIVHVFDKESRPFYNLEHVWSDGIEVEV